MTVVGSSRARPLLAVVAFSAWWACAVPAAADVVAEAKASVAALAGPQTGWNGPTSAPEPAPGRKIVYL
jgi:ribose transport system substrate-binding protein